MPDDGPYLGPRAYDLGDRGRFFGRDGEIRELLSLVVAHRVVLLYAPSGAGKTSLLNAGLIPLLGEDAGFDVLPIVRVRGLADPRAAANPYVANVLASLGDAPEDAGATTLAESFARRERLVDEDDFPAPTALVFDQFEELFSLYPERWAERREVFEQIAEALEQDELLRVVIALREDFVAQLDPHAALLPGGLRTRFRLDRLRPPAALAAVTRPLAGESRTFAPGTAERLIDGLLRVRVHTGRGESVEVPGEFVEPVQLQVVCRSLWEHLAPDVVEIRDEHVAAHGNVADVLARYYEEAVAAVAGDGAIAEADFRDRLEQAFITPVGTRGTVVAGEGEIAGIPLRAIEELERRHLVRAEWRAGARWFELTHDSLITPIRSSNAAVRRRAQALRERRLKALVAALVVLALALAGGGVWLLARDTTRAPDPLGVIHADGPMKGLALKRTFIAGAPLTSAAFTRDGHAVVAAGSDGRIRIWDVNVGKSVETLDYGGVGLASIDVAHDGRSLLAAGGLGPRRWLTGGLGTAPPASVRIRRSGLSPRLDSGQMIAAAGDPTGRWLAVVREGRAAVVDARKGHTVTGRLFSQQVLRIAWSPRRSRIAAVAVDGTVRIVRWTAPPPAVVAEPAEPAAAAPAEPAQEAPAAAPPATSRPRPAVTLRAGGAMVSAAFSPDGRTLLTASSDGRARLWRAQDGKLLETFGNGGSPLVSASFSPGGRLVVTAARNGHAAIFTIAGERIADIQASRRPLTGASFAVGGRLLVTAGTDGRARVWAVIARVRPLPRTAYLAASEYYTRMPRSFDGAALGAGGERYHAAVTVSAPSGSAVRAPEPALVVGLEREGPVQSREVRLRDTTGRVWVFSGVDPHARLGVRVAAGEQVATVPRGGGSTFVRIQLWQRAATGRRLGNLWNPALFLDVGAGQAVLPYPGDDAPREAIALWMGSVARAAGLPPELPVMAALAETGLRNVRGGDRDSVGFFLMRRSIWDQGEYAGFPRRPDIQLRWFVDTARSVREQHVARGERDFGTNPATYGEWAADIERPVEQDRDEYQPRLQEARRLLGISAVGA